jgi:hypothetical protein
MDMFHLTFPEASFECVLEKCTFEVLFVKEKDPWNTSEETIAKLRTVMQQVSQILSIFLGECLLFSAMDDSCLLFFFSNSNFWIGSILEGPIFFKILQKNSDWNFLA